MSWFIYVLKDPRTNEIRYVGYTNRPRTHRVRRLGVQRRGYRPEHIARLVSGNLGRKMPEAQRKRMSELRKGRPPRSGIQHGPDGRFLCADGGRGRAVDVVIRGEQHGGAKLSWSQVREMRSRRASGELLAALAKSFGVSKGCVHLIVSGKRWREQAAT